VVEWDSEEVPFTVLIIAFALLAAHPSWAREADGLPAWGCPEQRQDRGGQSEQYNREAQDGNPARQAVATASGGAHATVQQHTADPYTNGRDGNVSNSGQSWTNWIQAVSSAFIVALTVAALLVYRRQAELMEKQLTATNAAVDAAKANLIVHLTHSRPPPPWLGRLVAGRGIVSCPGVAVDGGGTGESAGIAG
jgi:hypothetical protein